MEGFHVKVSYRNQMYDIRFMWYTDERYQKIVPEITIDILVEMNNWLKDSV